MSRVVFYGFPSWIGSYTGSTTVAWWPVDPSTLVPAYDTSKQISNNLAMNPAAYNSSTIAFSSISVDDAPTTGGHTTIGPTFPGGTMTAGIFIESGFYSGLASPVKPPRVANGTPAHDYELTTVQYFGGVQSNRRFYGFYVEIQATAGASALCKIWNAGTGTSGGSGAGTYWFNLSTQAMAIEHGFTAVGVGASDPRTGALFLDSAAVAGVTLSYPKLPTSLGAGSLPR